MWNYVSDWERLTQLSLNKKIQELKQKEKEIQELENTIEALNNRLEENKETINLLCRQISSLVCNQHIHHA
jgi:predicted RNase H-like nuclease (RuvC/YqgF family)